MIEQLKKSDKIDIPKRFIILGLHKIKGFLYGHIVFTSEEAAHKHWNKPSTQKSLKKSGFTQTYFVLPK